MIHWFWLIPTAIISCWISLSKCAGCRINTEHAADVTVILTMDDVQHLLTDGELHTQGTHVKIKDLNLEDI